jgi:serine protease Do
MKFYVSALLSVIFAFATLQDAAQAADEQQRLQELSKAFVEIAQRASQSVVGIAAEASNENRNPGRRFEFRGQVPEDQFFEDQFFFQFPEGRGRLYRIPEESMQRQSNFGSGVLIDDLGRIVTVARLVEDSDKIEVALKDGKRLEAEVVGVDRETGIAVIKVDYHPPSAPRLGDSDAVAMGELVLAVGRNENLEPAVTMGMISGIGRMPPGVAYNGIELDADLRYGAGAAIVNTNGEIIAIGLGDSPEGSFAAPINTVKAVAAALIEHGKVARGWLGVMIQPVDSALAEKLGLEKPMGALVNNVGAGSPAEKAGLLVGDVITAVDGKPIKDVGHLRQVIAMYKPGAVVSVTVARGGEKRDISATLGERTREGLGRMLEEKAPLRNPADWRGLSLQDLTGELAEKFPDYKPNEGVLITGVNPGSPAAEAGEGEQKLQQGDLILQVEQKEVHSVDEFKTAVKGIEDKVLLLVKRGSGVWYLVIE